MSSLSSTSIKNALENFKSEARQLTKRLQSDFDKKPMGGNALRWIVETTGFDGAGHADDKMDATREAPALLSEYIPLWNR